MDPFCCLVPPNSSVEPNSNVPPNSNRHPHASPNAPPVLDIQYRKQRATTPSARLAGLCQVHGCHQAARSELHTWTPPTIQSVPTPNARAWFRYFLARECPAQDKRMQMWSERGLAYVLFLGGFAASLLAEKNGIVDQRIEVIVVVGEELLVQSLSLVGLAPHHVLCPC